MTVSVADHLVRDRPRPRGTVQGAPDEPSPRARGRIDPRFRQRRIDVQRQAGRKRLRALIGGTSVLVAMAVGLGVARSPLLVVRHVRVAGGAHVLPEALVDAAGLRGHHQMIDVHGGSAARAVERLPWVARARVTREWPATVRVTVTERIPVASVSLAAPSPPAPSPPAPSAPGTSASGPSGPDGGEGAVAVDGSGRVLAPLGADLHLPRLELRPDDAVSSAPPPPPPAPGSSLDHRYLAGLAVVRSLPSDLVVHVQAVEIHRGDAVQLLLSGGARVVLGSTDDLQAKLVAVLTLVERGKIDSGVLDVTVPSAPVLTPAVPIGNFSTRTGG